MTQNTLGTDHLSSWARRNGDGVEVHVRLVRALADSGPVKIELSAGDRRLLAPGEVTSDGRLVSFTVPAAGLGRSAWQIGVKAGEAEPVGLRARLLAAPGQPVALLSGSPPDTRMQLPASRPFTTRAHRLAHRLPSRARRALVRARDLTRTTRPRPH
jgi:hypothetical protein